MLANQDVVQIAPIGILSLDQPQLPGPIPSFDLFLACDRFVHIIVRFVSHEHVHGVPLGEAFDDAVLVLPSSADQIRGYARVKRAVPFASQNINEIKCFHLGPLPSHEPRSCSPGMTADVSRKTIVQASQQFRKLWHQHHASHRLPRLDVAVGGCGFLERKGPIDQNLKLPRCRVVDVALVLALLAAFVSIAFVKSAGPPQEESDR
jgi:hypothetical protein